VVIEDPAAVESPPGQPATVPTPRVEHVVARPVTPPVPIARRWWTVALALAVLVTAGGLWLLYNDDVSFQGALRARTTENESLQGQNLILQGQLTATQGNLTSAQADLTAARAELAHPHLGIWNVRQSIQGPTYYLAAGVPDTFTYHLRLKSTGPMNVSIVSFDQFSLAVRCIENGVGPTNYCMHHSGAANSWLGVRSIDTDFHLAEGCAAYLVVITAPGKVTVTPDVSVTYNPASHATGTCTS
jgi:hypothetical protein